MFFGLDYIKERIIMIPIVLIALTFHEFSHGLVSSKLGDPTPRLTGRMTLNPLAHLDPVGALLMVLTGFGWAKPVEINPRYYKNPKWGMAATAAAGPLSNLLLAFVSMLIWTILIIFGIKSGQLMIIAGNISYSIHDTSSVLIAILNFLARFATVNLCFMVFNFIPIPPLDGSRVLGLFLSDSAYFKLQQFERYSFILIIILSFANVFGGIIGTGVEFAMTGIMKVCGLLIRLVV